MALYFVESVFYEPNTESTMLMSRIRNILF